MKFFPLACVFFSVLLTSCKNQSGEVPASEKAKPATFDVVVEAVAPSANTLSLYYQDQPDQWFASERVVSLKVTPKAASQTLTLSLPEGVLPRDLQLNFGTAGEYPPIQLNSITLRYNGKSAFINKSEILDYFKPNQYVQYDTQTGWAKPVTVDGKCEPFFSTAEKIWGVITNINSGKM